MGPKTLSKFILGFRYVVPFRNQTPLKAKSCTFLTPVTISEKMGEISESVFIGKSSTVLLRVMGFRYVAPFWNQSASEATGVKNRSQILYFVTPVKLGKGWARSLSGFYQFGTGPNLLYTFDGALLSRLENLRAGVKKKILTAKLEAFRNTYLGRPKVFSRWTFLNFCFRRTWLSLREKLFYTLL